MEMPYMRRSYLRTDKTMLHMRALDITSENN
jgi:hypothetical protein